MRWANLIHIYQPPTQRPAILDQIVRECYLPLVRLLLAEERARITINISGCLTRALAKGGYGEVIEGLAKAAQLGRVEFATSGLYHPILPLLPQALQQDQLAANQETNARLLGPFYRPRGLFPPEMCVDETVLDLAQMMGLGWVALDSMAVEGPYRPVVIHRRTGLFLVPRHRGISNSLSACTIATVEDLKRACQGQGDVLVTATDGEIYGHHQKGHERLLIEAFRDPEVEPLLFSDLVEEAWRCPEVLLRPSAWSSLEAELAEGLLYPQWKDPTNDIHRLQWMLVALAAGHPDALGDLEEGPSNPRGPDPALEGGLVTGPKLGAALHSCQFWWGSCRPWWDTTMILWGAQLIKEAALDRQDLPPQLKGRATELYSRLEELVAHWQRSGIAASRRRSYLKTVPGMDLLTFG